MITVAETRAFLRKVATLLSERERTELIDYLAEHPNAGALIQGTGGIRKLRWAQSGRGKRGSVRIIYYFHSDEMPLYLLTLFAKNERANLSKQERNDLAKAAKELVAAWRKRNEQGLH